MCCLPYEGEADDLLGKVQDLENEVIELKRQLANARHRPSPPDTSSGPTFAEMKLLPTYRKVAVIVHDGELGFDRVSAYHHSVEDALETARKMPSIRNAAIYVRHDQPTT